VGLAVEFSTWLFFGHDDPALFRFKSCAAENGPQDLPGLG